MSKIYQCNTAGIIATILLFYPSLMLTVKGGMNGMFLLLLVISFHFLLRTAKLRPHWDQQAITFALAMASPFLATLLSQIYHGKFDMPSYDWTARFLLAIPIYLALRQIDFRANTVLQLGIPIGALTGLIVIRFHPATLDGVRATTGSFINAIHFADLAIMLGFLSLLALNRALRDAKWIVALKLCGFVAGIYMAIQAGERGAWLAAPLLVFVWVYGQNPQKLAQKLLIVSILMIVFALFAYSNVELIHLRINAAFQDIVAYSNGNRDTSLGIRIQLWQAAIHVFLQNPLFGLGSDGFREIMPTLAEQKILTHMASVLGTSEVHNEILSKCANLGIFGLLSILAVYIVPAKFFWMSLNTSVGQKKVASLMGLGLVLGFFIFGLTVEIFDLKMTAAFYALTLAVLLGTSSSYSQFTDD